jgi:thiosulfate/3-mercaptopyruvate sulfurtransferase
LIPTSKNAVTPHILNHMRTANRLLTAACGAAIFTATTTATLTTPAHAQAAPVLVSADWVAQHLKDPKVMVIHASQQKSDYDTGHIPGSRWLPWTSYSASTPGGLSTQLPDPAPFDSALQAVGINDDSHIVISGGPVQVSGRLFYTLEYMGLAGRVSLLDGGIDAWREAVRPIERVEAVAAQRGNVTLHPVAARVADAAWMNANGATPGVSILDARLPEFYSGESAGGQPRAGHIPGANNVPFSWLTGEVSTFRDKAKLQRLFDQAGVKKGNKVVTYCHIGMQASALYVAARVLGYDAAVYDGSWEEWSRKTELPLVGPAKP